MRLWDQDSRALLDTLLSIIEKILWYRYTLVYFNSDSRTVCRDEAILGLIIISIWVTFDTFAKQYLGTCHSVALWEYLNTVSRVLSSVRTEKKYIQHMNELWRICLHTRSFLVLHYMQDPSGSLPQWLQCGITTVIIKIID